MVIRDAPADLRYQHWDLRSVRLVTNGNGNQVDTQSHDAFGGVMDEGGAVPPFFTTYFRENVDQPARPPSHVCLEENREIVSLN